MVTQVPDSKHWSGFAPYPHSLNDRIVWSLPIMREVVGGGSGNETMITLGEAFKQVIPARVRTVEYSPLGTLKVVTDAGESRYGGTRFNVQLLRAILALHRDSFESFGSQWFWFDSSFSTHDLDSTTYGFFVVSRNQIALEHATFASFPGSGFNPEVFVPPNRDLRGYSWSSHRYYEDASIEYWYRQFYRETMTGQLMVLRPDKPALHHFAEGRWHPSTGVYAVVDQLLHIRWLLYILIALGIANLVVLLLK